jgi:hypothetical protein
MQARMMEGLLLRLSLSRLCKARVRLIQQPSRSEGATEYYTYVYPFYYDAPDVIHSPLWVRKLPRQGDTSKGELPTVW